MGFELDPEQRAFRDELCALLTAELTPDVCGRYYDELEYGDWNVAFREEFRRKLGERGYIGMAWPAEFGGGGKDLVYQVILSDELQYHGAPGIEPATTYLPQVLMVFGSAEQKARFLPRLLRGELSIFLGYSEPEAGSDLANLKTQAVADGDSFVLTGQKVYSSRSHFAHYGLVAARSDPSSSRYAGISLFLVEMKCAGISIARHRTVAGWDHHSVYFDQVVVPRTMLVGPLHEGWRVLMGAIDYERAAIAAPGLVDRQLDRLLAYALAPAADGSRAADDPRVRDGLVTLAVETEAARLYAYAVYQRQARGERPQHETSLSLLLKREAARLADVTGVEFLGPYAQLRRGSPHAPSEGAVEREYREHLYFHFAAGGFDITRNVIAARGLKMPR